MGQTLQFKGKDCQNDFSKLYMLFTRDLKLKDAEKWKVKGWKSIYHISCEH